MYDNVLTMARRGLFASDHNEAKQSSFEWSLSSRQGLPLQPLNAEKDARHNLQLVEQGDETIASSGGTALKTCQSAVPFASDEL
jgi:hypothetical protein